MYFDPTLRQTETKADPFELGTLVAWLEKQPADKRYCYSSGGHCLLARYFSAHGFSKVEMQPYFFLHSGGREKLPAALDIIACNGPSTYGAALGRARAFEE